VRKKTLTLGLVLTLVVGVGAAALAYRLFFMRLVRVPTGAMMNTILPGDRLVTNRSFGAIKRGWIVVFKYPGDSRNYIARVIGLPGETVEVRDRSVYVNGHMLEEQRVLVNPDDLGEADVLEEVSIEGAGPYRVFYTTRKDNEISPVPSDMDSANLATHSPFEIPLNSFFMLGDNRDNSYDSRFRGAVPRELIWGTTSVVYFSAFSNRKSHEERVRWNRMFSKVK
jgi:signal peptidase I